MESNACYLDGMCGCGSGLYDHDDDPSTACLVCGAGNVTNTLDVPGATSCMPCSPNYFDDDSNPTTACVACGFGSAATASVASSAGGSRDGVGKADAHTTTRIRLGAFAYRRGFW